MREAEYERKQQEDAARKRYSIFLFSNAVVNDITTYWRKFSELALVENSSSLHFSSQAT